MSTYDRIAGLPVTIEGYSLEVLSLELAPEFRRLTTVIHLHGAGEEGVGEDVCYEPADHEAQEAAGPWLPVAGAFTLDGFSRHLEPFDLFMGAEPGYPGSREYRRWAFESAALDLALRQAGASLADALGITPSPVTFVVSTRLDEPADSGRVRRWLAREPSLRFKLDPTDTWTDALIAELRELDVVSTVDLKGCYTGTPVDGSYDPGLYRRLVEGLPGAWIEDPRLTPEIVAVLAGHEDRLTWDAPIHSVADILALDHPPRMINMKPSRFGPLRELFADLRPPGAPTASGPTAAGRPSSARGAATSSTWPPSSTPTRPTTWRPAATTSPRRRTSCPRARCRSAPGRSDSAGASDARRWIRDDDRGPGWRDGRRAQQEGTGRRARGRAPPGAPRLDGARPPLARRPAASWTWCWPAGGVVAMCEVKTRGSAEALAEPLTAAQRARIAAGRRGLRRRPSAAARTGASAGRPPIARARRALAHPACGITPGTPPI